MKLFQFSFKHEAVWMLLLSYAGAVFVLLLILVLWLMKSWAA